MNALLDWGVEIVLWLQQWRPALDGFFEAITLIGGEEFLMVLLPLLYWCLDYNLGRRMVVLFLFNAYLNTLGKVLAHQPRPFMVDDRVWSYKDMDTGGFPSGHTQNVTVVWGFLASQLRQRWTWIVAGILLILVPLSRMYLGVHFPHDLLGGYVLGALLLFVYLKWESALGCWFTNLDTWQQYALLIVVALLVALTVPTEDGIAAAAVTLGGGTGLLLEKRYVHFSITGSWVQRSLRMLLGMIVLLGLWAGMRAAFADLEPVFVFRFIRYGLVGAWVSWGAPWLFVKIGLAQPQNN